MPGYVAANARGTLAGVGGSIMHGGQSWMSSEYWLACGAQKMLDAQVVKMDREVLQASTEPDLLFALRS